MNMRGQCIWLKGKHKLGHLLRKCVFEEVTTMIILSEGVCHYVLHLYIENMLCRFGDHYKDY